MNADNSKILFEALTYDDVLLLPDFSDVLPRDTETKTQLTRNIQLNIPLVSAAMDTVTEAKLAISMALEGGIGIIHKNMTIEQQAAQVRKVKRSQSGMILDPITLAGNGTAGDAELIMKENKIGGIPVVDDNHKLIGIVTNRDLRFEKNARKPVSEIMTKDNLITANAEVGLAEAEETRDCTRQYCVLCRSLQRVYRHRSPLLRHHRDGSLRSARPTENQTARSS